MFYQAHKKRAEDVANNPRVEDYYIEDDLGLQPKKGDEYEEPIKLFGDLEDHEIRWSNWSKLIYQINSHFLLGLMHICGNTEY